MNPPSPDEQRLLVTSGTASWERKGADDEHDLLADFLEEVATTGTIQDAITRSIQAMQLLHGSRVLDVGCGTGVLFPQLAKAVGASGRIVGLDHGEGFLADARKRAVERGFSHQVELFRGDAHSLPFADNSFDAAHTERVLMHLSDPDQALRELRRVVRPGGRVVCVEPDLVGMRMDHIDPESAAAIISGFCASIQNPAMGLELNRRMATAGLVDRRIEVITEVERDFPDDVAAFFRKAADRAITMGWLSPEVAERALLAMRESGSEDQYVSYSSMFIVSGRVPGA